MLMTIFILYFIFVAVVGVFISFLLIKQDLEIRRQKAIIDENASRSQNNTKELEKFYVEKKHYRRTWTMRSRPLKLNWRMNVM